MFPAKYSFDAGSGALTAANCTNDYVVYALDVAGTALQPNIVRFNNIYSGTGGFCGTAPSVQSAYWVNTLDTLGSSLNGKMLTSPALSLLGDKVASLKRCKRHRESVQAPHRLIAVRFFMCSRGARRGTTVHSRPQPIYMRPSRRG